MQKEKIVEDINWILSRYNKNIFNSDIYKNLSFIKSENNAFKRVFSKKYNLIKKELKNNFIGANLNCENLLKDLTSLERINTVNNLIKKKKKKIPFTFRKI